MLQCPKIAGVRAKIERLFLLFLIYSLLSTNNIFGQQDNAAENYYLHEHLILPAAAGANYYPVTGLTFRKQWTGIESSPQTFIVSANFRLGHYDFYTPKMFLNKSKYKGRERMGFGLAYYNDINGPLQKNNFTLTYAYHLPFELFSLSFGLDMSYNDININYSELSPTDPNDPYLYSDKSKVIYPQSGFGVQLTNELFFTSFSVKNLLPNNFLDEKGFSRSAPDYYFYGGVTMGTGRLFSLEPSVMLMKCDNLPFGWSSNAKLYFNYYNWLSVSYRSEEKLVVNLMLRVIESFNIGYGYEFFFSNISSGSRSGHNIYIGRNFGLRNVYGIRKNVKQKFL